MIWINDGKYHAHILIIIRSMEAIQSLDRSYSQC
jgi:hypothetical protein